MISRRSVLYWIDLYFNNQGVKRMKYNYVGGVSFLNRDSGRNLILLGYHPANSPTWYWSISILRYKGDEERCLFKFQRADIRTGQWHDYLHVCKWRKLSISRQDYHKRHSLSQCKMQSQ